MESAWATNEPTPCKDPESLISYCNDKNLKDVIKCLYTNADTLTNKLDELKAVVDI